MKRNIDLTLKRDFNNKNESTSNIIVRDLINRLGINTKIPWKMENHLTIVNNDYDLIQDNELINSNIIILGNKSKRDEIKHRMWINSNICECCGRTLEKFPWKIKYGLCDNCNNAYYKTSNIAWKDNDETLDKRICWR